MIKYLRQLLLRSTLLGSLLGCVLAHSALAATPTLSFVANRGQWPAAVRYRASLPGGTAFLTSTGVVYDWLREADRSQLHEALAQDPATSTSLPLHHHAVFVDFVGAQHITEPTGELPQAAYHNYFVGNDPHRWAGHVPLYSEVRYAGLYPGTSLRYHGTAGGQLEYDFELAPGASPAAIGLRYRGASSLQLLEDGSLLVQTSVGQVHEQRPVAYQLTAAGGRQAVPCRYTLAGTTVGFALPAGYDATRPLIIDPVVMATYSRSTADQLALAATYDAAGNAYSSGYSSGVGFPTSPGAYQTTSKGNTEAIILKFNPQCTSLFYATYLGGNSDDRVIAMQVSAAGELYALTSTYSTNFPATSGSLSTTPGGQGDLAITRFNTAGTAVLASTYLGGSNNDTPYTPSVTGSIRSLTVGELVLNPNGEVLVTGSTTSANFPTTSGTYSPSARGLQDVFVTCLAGSNLSLRWSTLLGGTNAEYPRDLTLTAAGEPVLAGVTNSGDFPVTTRAFQTTTSGYYAGFVVRLSATGAALKASALFEASSIAKVVLDASGLPVIAGGTTSAFLASTAGAVQLGNSSGAASFVAGLSADFSKLRYAGRFPTVDISAFQIDDCGHLFLAGFNTPGLPTTGGLLAGSNANGGFQTLTLDVGASRLLFYSPFGTNSGNHTHSGSHRFTRTGTLYQSICDNTHSYAAPATAYSPTNRSAGYDVLTFSINQAVAGSAAPALVAGIVRPDSACAPSRFQFGNSSRNAQRYRWTFGDGSPADTTFAPSHVYAAPGTYRVWLLARRATVSGCGGNTADSASVVVRVLSLPGRALPATAVLCTNSSLTLQAASGAGYTYRWSTGATTRTLAVNQGGTYRVVVSNGVCSTRDSVVVRAVVTPRLPADTTLCANGSLNLQVQAAPSSTIRWEGGQTTSTLAVSTSGTYGVAVTTDGCTFTRQVRVELRRTIQPPNVITPNGDGLNDVLELRPLEPGTHLQLFNRWGRLVYSTTDYHNDWGPDQAAGLYYYVLENERYCQSRVKGWVEVIR